MQDVRLIKDQNRWIAHVMLEDGKHAPMSLKRELTDEEAANLNQARREDRKREVMPLLKQSVSFEQEIRSYLPLANVSPQIHYASPGKRQAKAD